jgi:hypothetical protein
MTKTEKPKSTEASKASCVILYGYDESDKPRAARFDKVTNHELLAKAGVASLGSKAVERIVKTITVYDDFCHDNDPYGEHDFRSFEADGATIFFKIDYYDRSLAHGSPDPSDPTITRRVITIMLAHEY